MENLVIRGKISTTSNKQSDQFKVETPQKTAYLELDEKEGKRLEKFGVAKYTSKDGDDFYCVKIVNDLKMYLDVNSKDGIPMDTSVESNNFQTADDVVIGMNIIKGNKNKNDFFRLQAVLLKDTADIVELQAENPFAE